MPRAGTQDSKQEYGTDAKKKGASITMAEAEVQLVPGVPTTTEKTGKAATTEREGVWACERGQGPE